MSRTAAFPLRRGGVIERVSDRPRLGGGDRESEYDRRLPFVRGGGDRDRDEEYARRLRGGDRETDSSVLFLRSFRRGDERERDMLSAPRLLFLGGGDLES